MTAAPAAPLTNADFARAMAPFAPFEATPHLAVAVSGGRDSLALTLLAHDWACAAGGHITALTVDHGLRPAAAAEARHVGRWLKARGIAHRVLRWRGARPARDVQAAARAARYDLLTAWCRQHAVLHLALGHQREDQAETLLLRLGRGSGADGLAAMAAVAERSHVRLLRPLLDVPRARLAEALEARGQPWLDDPSNEDRAHARVALRAALPALGDEGLSVARLAATAHRLGRARQALEAVGAALLAEAVDLHPAGFARLALTPLRAAPAEVALRVLAGLLATIGGGAHPPRHDRLMRLYAALCTESDARPRTLAGCRIAVRRDHAVVSREAAAVREVLPLTPGAEAVWDGRYAVRVGRGAPRGLELRRLGASGWRAALEIQPEWGALGVPAAARPALPAVWRGKTLIGLADPRYGRAGGAPASLGAIRVRHRPVRALTTAPFGIV